MAEGREVDDIDWILTTWEGSRRDLLERCARMSLDEILEVQEDMAELSADLARQADGDRASDLASRANDTGPRHGSFEITGSGQVRPNKGWA